MDDLGRMNAPDPRFWQGRRVLLTGHTGFKGSWLACILQRWGAEVTGVALPSETTPNLFELLSPWSHVDSHLVDIRDRAALAETLAGLGLEVVFHLAAQPLVRRSYREPVETMATNVMGTLHLLEALRTAPTLKAVLLVTSDKVYRNTDDGRAFAEDGPLGGDDPYSASKACAEIAVHSWRKCGLLPTPARLATVRAGNVIGGGDYGEDRLLPDAVRAVASGEPLPIRSPAATRPWQHVLDVSCAYLLYAEALATGDPEVPHALNIGPDATDRHTVLETVTTFLKALEQTVPIESGSSAGMPEKTLLSLDPTLARRALGWRQRLSFAEAVAWTAEWYAAVAADTEVARPITERQIDTFFERGA